MRDTCATQWQRRSNDRTANGWLRLKRETKIRSFHWCRLFIQLFIGYAWFQRSRRYRVWVIKSRYRYPCLIILQHSSRPPWLNFNLERAHTLVFFFLRENRTPWINNIYCNQGFSLIRYLECRGIQIGYFFTKYLQHWVLDDEIRVYQLKYNFIGIRKIVVDLRWAREANESSHCLFSMFISSLTFETQMFLHFSSIIVKVGNNW